MTAFASFGSGRVSVTEKSTRTLLALGVSLLTVPIW